MKLLADVRRALADRGLLRPGDRVLLAVSGGADSVALLVLLQHLAGELGIHLAVAHLDHGLRGEESAEDAAFVASLARERDLPFFGGRADVALLARERRISLEMAARDARYRFLGDTARACPATCVATGHTADDLAETMLLFLARGAGPAALRGFPWKRELVPGIGLIRPLRGVRRADLAAFLAARGVAWRHDRSNDDPGPLRNRVRHEVIPGLERNLNPGVVAALGRAADRWSEVDEVVEGLVAEALRACLLPADSPDRVMLDASRLRGYHRNLHGRVLRAAASLVVPRPLNAVQVRALVALARSGDGAMDLPAAHRALGRRDTLVIEPGTTRPGDASSRSAPGATGSVAAPRTAVQVRVPGRTRLAGRNETESFLLASMFDRAGRRKVEGADDGGGGWTGLGNAAAGSAVFDWDALHPPLEARHPRPGDRMRPLGMTGTKKLQDILVDRRVPRENRGALWIVSDQERILWLVGIVMCEEAKVTGGTTRRLVLERVGA